MLTERVFCPQCGKALAVDAPQGLCPECLLKAAMPGQSALESAATGLYQDNSPSTTAISPEARVRLQYFGDYELLEEIARGGMGVVWKARQSSLNRTVALKMIRAGALASKDEVIRFLREAEAAANLQHPNIVAIHEVGEHGGQHYFSMDYVQGRDLGVLVQAEGPLQPQRAARYVKIIAEAIHFAHQRGTLHRDLKPQNVLIDQADHPRITDFGLAKIMEQDSRLTHSGVVMGSPSYMPPEQAAGRHGEIGPASDVYSLGAMLYELLTGRPPFRSTTAMATMRMVMEAEPTSPRRLKSDVPPDLETICLKCLEKSPAARYPSARELAEELDRYLKGEPIFARPASTLRKVVSWGRRHPGLLAAAAALLVVALGFGSFYLIEENAFLRAQQADPTLERTIGPLHENLNIWNTINSFLSMAGIFAVLWVIRKARGSSWKDLYDPAQNLRSLGPMGDGTRTFAVCAGLVCLSSGVLFLAKLIQAQVWEGDLPASYFLSVFATTWWGLALLAFVVRDLRISQFGAPSRQLSPEQMESIRKVLEEMDVVAAIRLYRKAVPDAGLAEAREYVLHLLETLRAREPEKYVLPPLSLATLNWSLMLMCGVFEAALFFGLYVLMPPLHPFPFAFHFASGLLFGMGISAGLRVKGFWKRMLLLIPWMVVTISGEAIVSRTDPEAARSWLPYVVGILFGSFLIVSGFTRRGRKVLS